jgi:hypothetical protein
MSNFDSGQREEIERRARNASRGGYDYVQGTEPTSPKEGETWYDTSTNVKEAYVYNGSQWLQLSVVDHGELGNIQAGDHRSDENIRQTVDGSNLESLGIGSLFTTGSVSDETSNRSLSTTYTNDTGNLLQIWVQISHGTDGEQFGGTLEINGTQVVKEDDVKEGSSTGSSWITISEIIPPGVDYYIGPFVNGTLSKWSEMPISTN